MYQNNDISKEGEGSAGDAYISCRMDNVKVLTDMISCLIYDVHHDEDCEVTASKECKWISHEGDVF
jgi:hypothetical protein